MSEDSKPPSDSGYASVDDCIRDRPESLTGERAESFLPTMDVCEEWQRKKDKGDLPDGLLGMSGMLKTSWPDSKPTLEEARWMLALSDFGSWRWFASMVTYGDDNQMAGIHLLEAANDALAGKAR